MTAPVRSPAPARRGLGPTDLALVAFFAALIAVCAILPGIPVGGAVPITLQTFAIGLGAAVLGAKRGTLAVLLYVVVGLAGLPVFTGGRGGLAVLAGPSIGYIVGWPLATLLSGWLVQRYGRRAAVARVPVVAVCLLVGNAVFVHPLGIVGMALRVEGWSLWDAFRADLIFWPGDVVKCVVAAVVAVAVHRAFPDLLPRRR